MMIRGGNFMSFKIDKIISVNGNVDDKQITILHHKLAKVIFKLKETSRIICNIEPIEEHYLSNYLRVEEEVIPIRYKISIEFEVEEMEFDEYVKE
jgi:hypothetical protein